MTNMAESLNITTNELLRFVSRISSILELFALTHLVVRFILEKMEKFVVVRDNNGLLLKVVKENAREIKVRIIPVNEVHYIRKKLRMINHGDMIIVNADELMNVIIQLTPTMMMGIDVCINVEEFIRRRR